MSYGNILINTPRLIGSLMFVFLLAACRAEEPESLKIVPVFGVDRINISGDVNWSATKVGIIETEQRDNEGNLVGFTWKSKLDSYGQDNLYPITEGEIGIKLSLGNYIHYSKHTISSADSGLQTLEIAIADIPRIILNAEGLSDNALTELTIDTPRRGSFTSRTGWLNHKGALYLSDAGRNLIKLTNTKTNESHTKEIVVGKGETVKINFKFIK